MIGAFVFAAEKADNSSDLVKPFPGLMIWTLVVFFIAFLVLRKYAFGPLAALVEKRRTIVRENLEAAEHSREEAERLLEEYKQQLAQARREAGEIVERARRTGSELERQMREEATAQRERDVAAAKAAIAAETRQAIDQIKNQVAELTMLATEKVVGRALDEDEGRRLVEEALAEVDFSAARGGVAGWQTLREDGSTGRRWRKPRRTQVACMRSHATWRRSATP